MRVNQYDEESAYSYWLWNNVVLKVFRAAKVTEITQQLRILWRLWSAGRVTKNRWDKIWQPQQLSNYCISSWDKS